MNQLTLEQGGKTARASIYREIIKLVELDCERIKLEASIFGYRFPKNDEYSLYVESKMWISFLSTLSAEELILLLIFHATGDKCGISEDAFEKQLLIPEIEQIFTVLGNITQTNKICSFDELMSKSLGDIIKLFGKFDNKFILNRAENEGTVHTITKS